MRKMCTVFYALVHDVACVRRTSARCAIYEVQPTGSGYLFSLELHLITTLCSFTAIFIVLFYVNEDSFKCFGFLPFLSFASHYWAVKRLNNSTALVGATVLVGEALEVTSEANILFENGRISCVGTDDICPMSNASQVIDASGKWVIPGLVDFHTHVAEYSSMPWAPLFLAYGITTVRDLGGRTDSSFALRQRWQTDYSGPNLFIAGHPIDGNPPNWPASFPDVPWSVDAPEEARAKVREAHSLGVDYIKLYNGLSPEALHSAIQEARSLGLNVTADLWIYNTPTSTVIESGLNGLEHLIGEIIDLPNPNYTGGRARLAWGRDDDQLIEIIDKMVESQVLLTTTMLLTQYFGHDFPEHKKTFQSLPVALQDTSRVWMGRVNNTIPDFAKDFFQDVFQDQMCRTVMELQRRGGLVAAGTDSFWLTSYPGDIHEELRLLQECGFSPQEALAAATLTPTNWFGADSLGRIEGGSIADFVVLNADPMADISNTKEIEYVVRRGNILYPSDLIEQVKTQ